MKKVTIVGQNQKKPNPPTLNADFYFNVWDKNTLQHTPFSSSAAFLLSVHLCVSAYTSASLRACCVRGREKERKKMNGEK